MPEINGTEGNDPIEGTDGDDVINALGGNDTIHVSRGKDVVHGGSGMDSLHFASSSSIPFFVYDGPVKYILMDGHVFDSQGVYDVTFDGIEYVYFVPYNTGPADIDASGWGNSANPGSRLILSVGEAGSRVIGSEFDDYITAGGINTMIDTGPGQDVVLVTTGNGEAGTIYITTSNGVTNVRQDAERTNGENTSIDIANAEHIGLSPQRNPYVHNLLDASGSGVSLYFLDDYSKDTVIGSPHDDIFVNSRPQYPANWDDTDIFSGGEGADQFLFTGGGIRSFDKTFITDFSGEDWIDLNNNLRDGYFITTFIGAAGFSGTAGEYRYEKSSGHTLLQFDGDGDGIADGTLTLLNGEFDVKQITLSTGLHGLALDLPAPSGANDEVIGSSSNDVLNGLGGDDTLRGMAGDDVLIGGLGADMLFGGSGIDTTSYAGDEGAVFVNLTLGKGYVNSSFGDTYDSMENVIGSSYDDFLIGDGNVNRLDGGPGNDTVVGAVGADVLIGSDGVDLLSFEDNSGTVFVDLAAGRGFNNAAQGDTFEGFENVVGGLFDDTLIGDNGANRLDGALGADTLVGNGGADTFVFAHAPGAASGFDHSNANANVDTIFDFASGEDRLEISASAFGGGLTAGALAGDRFLVGTAAGDADDRFVYDQGQGRLYFDADGNGAGAQVLVAILPNHDAIAAADFVIV